MLLVKTGKGLRGIMASGVALSPSHEARHWNSESESTTTRFVQVRFERLADYTKGEILRIHNQEDLGFNPQSSGCRLPEGRASALLARFHAYIAAPTPVAEDIQLQTRAKRASISLSLRYSVFERDAYTCRYCGRSAPEVILHVDHVITQVEWREQFTDLLSPQIVNGVNLQGVNDPLNLRTSCADCNLGKGRRSGTLSLS